MLRTLALWLPAVLILLTPSAAQRSMLEVDGSRAPRRARPVRTQLAGRSLEEYPHFEYVQSFHVGEPVEIALNPVAFAPLLGKTVDVYVVEHRLASQWLEDRELRSVTGAVERLYVDPRGVRHNKLRLSVGGLLARSGPRLGRGYDIVLDGDGDGLLGDGDWIDGLGREAGFYLVEDPTQPGPFQVIRVRPRGIRFRRQLVYYPREVDSLGKLPLVVVSHGNGHNFGWYGHIGNHLASYGYIVVSHENNTGPGPLSASTTTLGNTRWFLNTLDQIGGGVLEDHVDRHRIVWLGHSRGGEGVVLAYDRLRDADPNPWPFEPEDIVLVSSIAPTNFEPERSDPGLVNFHLWVGGADADVTGCAESSIAQPFQLHDRASGSRVSISLHGVGHADFHSGPTGSVADGPCRVGRPDTHRLMRGYLLPLLEYYVYRRPAGRDYLWRQWESFRPPGAPTSPCVVVDLLFQEGASGGKRVLEDFQTNEAPDLSSSGGAVSFSVDALVEDVLNDRSVTFQWNPNDPMNGMTMAGTGDTSRGVVFEFDGEDEHYTLEVPEGLRDVRRHVYLSFRAAQGTRHPLTRASLGDLQFQVRLIDADLDSSTIGIGAYGGGVEEPYQRVGCGNGSGPGWNNEFETLRLRLTDFRTDNPRLDLGDIVAIQFLFGPSHGSAEGRVALDEIELTGGN